MSTNYLHRTLIFLLPKLYFTQVFIQHTVTSSVTKLYIPEDILFDVLSNRHIFRAKQHYSILYCMSFERKSALIELLLCSYAIIAEKCKW